MKYIVNVLNRFKADVLKLCFTYINQPLGTYITSKSRRLYAQSINLCAYQNSHYKRRKMNNCINNYLQFKRPFKRLKNA